jgi:hypothetical protein
MSRPDSWKERNLLQTLARKDASAIVASKSLNRARSRRRKEAENEWARKSASLRRRLRFVAPRCVPCRTSKLPMNRSAGFIPQDRPLAPGAWESSAIRNIERSCGLKSALLLGSCHRCASILGRSKGLMNRSAVTPTFQSARLAGWKTGATRLNGFMAPMRRNKS